MNKRGKNVRKKTAKKRPAVDRRIQRTRALLRDALTACVLDKGYETTTVQDILDRANLGRSTFYSHYADKHELLVSGFVHLKELFEEHDAHQSGGKPERAAQRYPLTLLFFRHAAENYRLYKAILKSKQGSEIVQHYLYKMITTVAGRHLKTIVPKGKQTPVPEELIVHFLVTSLLGVLTWWLNHDMPYSPEEVLEMYHRLTLPGINAGLGKEISH